MSDLTSLFTDTLAKFSFRAVLSAAATLLICLVAVHLLGKLLRRLLALCARKNLQLSQRALHTAPKTIRGRLMSYLSECAVRSGSSSFDIPYDRRQLAGYLGVERSALCAELSRMCRDGLILYGKRRFTLVTDLDD